MAGFVFCLLSSTASGNCPFPLTLPVNCKHVLLCDVIVIHYNRIGASTESDRDVEMWTPERMFQSSPLLTNRTPTNNKDGSVSDDAISISPLLVPN